MQPIAATDVYDQALDKFLDPATVKELSKINPWRGVAQIALEWIGIAAAIVLCEAYWHPLLYIATVAWIGARQNGLAVMMHESTHYRLLTNRTWNEWIGEIFCAWPILVTVNGYRQTHFAHHRHVNKAGDPDWQRKQKHISIYFPTSVRQFMTTTLKYWLGFYAVMEMVGINQETKIPPSVQRLRLAFYAAVIAAAVAFGFWQGLIMYWIVPLATYFIWVVFVRTIAEHGIEDPEDVLQKTRHVDANLFERLMISPNNINHHIAHHLYPSVPFYNLRKAQALLMQNPNYARRAYVVRHYPELLTRSIEENRKHFVKGAA